MECEKKGCKRKATRLVRNEWKDEEVGRMCHTCSIGYFLFNEAHDPYKGTGRISLTDLQE